MDVALLCNCACISCGLTPARYTIDREELCRRIYGPETLNVHNVTDMVTSGAAPIGATAVTGASPAVGAGVAGAGSRLSEAQVKARLLAADFDCPACPPVTSAFSRLCEGVCVCSAFVKSSNKSNISLKKVTTWLLHVHANPDCFLIITILTRIAW